MVAPESPEQAGPAAEALELALRRAAAALPTGGEDRPGQLAMAAAVGRAVAEGRHLVVQAGTGTGKSLAYLLPVAMAGTKTVVATATKALQDQLHDKDLPLVAGALAGERRLRFAVLKGRSNYVCRQRVAEVAGRVAAPGAPPAGVLFPAGATEEPDAAPVWTPELHGETSGAGDLGLADQVRHLVAWADETVSGDRAELPFEPHPRAWASVSVGPRECPGAFRCPSGPDCFAEHARAKAAAADVVVVNTHLYATHVASGGVVLPEHDVLVLDEAHAVEEVMTAGLGIELTAGRVRAAATGARGLLAQGDAGVADGVADAADRIDGVLRQRAGARVLRRPGDDAELLAVLELTGGRVAALAGVLRRRGDEDDEPAVGQRRARALLAAGHLGTDLGRLAALDDGQVAWVEAGGPGGRQLTLRAAPVDVGPVLAEQLWPAVTGVLTSATVPPQIERALGLPGARTDRLDVGSPFPYRQSSLLYCPVDLPDRRSEAADAAVHEELRRLVVAAGGRTLALFTSWRAMRAATEALRPQLPFTVLAQGDLPKPALVAAFAGEESSCLFATMSFWQGVDVPGATLSLVAVDRLPFPRPDDPLLEARRERAGEAAFRLVDLPRAATLLAQGAGRLVRSATDRGVVAVLDRRLATAGYRRAFLEVLPPMPFTTERARALSFLEAIAAERAAAAG